MTDRVPSDHATVDSRRVHLSTVGRTRRFQILLPEDLDCELEDVIFCSLEGDGRWAQVTPSLDGELTVRDAYPTRQAARTETGENELRTWLDSHGMDAGDALQLDVLREGYAYGLRRPGERVVYSPPDPPDSSLADIARDLDG